MINIMPKKQKQNLKGGKVNDCPIKSQNLDIDIIELPSDGVPGTPVNTHKAMTETSITIDSPITIYEPQYTSIQCSSPSEYFITISFDNDYRITEIDQTTKIKQNTKEYSNNIQLKVSFWKKESFPTTDYIIDIDPLSASNSLPETADPPVTDESSSKDTVSMVEVFEEVAYVLLPDTGNIVYNQCKEYVKQMKTKMSEGEKQSIQIPTCNVELPGNIASILSTIKKEQNIKINKKQYKLYVSDSSIYC